MLNSRLLQEPSSACSGRLMPSKEDIQVCNSHTVDLLKSKATETETQGPGSSKEKVRAKIVSMYLQVLQLLTGSGDWNSCFPEREIMFDVQKFRYQPIEQRSVNNSVKADQEPKVASMFGPQPINYLRRNVGKFTKILAVLQQALQYQAAGTTTMKRELFYQHRAVLESQDELDAVLVEVCFRLRLPRGLLGVAGSSRGLVIGSASCVIAIPGSCDPQALDNSGSALVFDLREFGRFGKIESVWTPGSYQIKAFQADFVLVVEKEACLTDLVQSGFLNVFSNCLLVTARGYPDYATRILLQQLLFVNPLVPFFYLGDYDPHGLDIALQYLYGTPATYYENVELPQIEPIGLDADELIGLGVAETTLPKLELTAEDIKKGVWLLEQPFFKYLSPVSHQGFQSSFEKLQNSKLLRLRRSLTKIMQRGWKCEVEALTSTRDGLIWRYLEMKIGSILAANP